LKIKPKLIHPVDVVFQNVDKLAMSYDADFREPTGSIVYGNSFTIKCQVKIFRQQRLEGNPSGFQYKGDGYVLMYRDDAARVKVNDKIVNIDGNDVEFHIIDKIPIVHYDNSNMTMVYFESKDKTV
jgi:hypothetical protein